MKPHRGRLSGTNTHADGAQAKTHGARRAMLEQRGPIKYALPRFSLTDRHQRGVVVLSAVAMVALFRLRLSCETWWEVLAELLVGLIVIGGWVSTRNRILSGQIGVISNGLLMLLIALPWITNGLYRSMGQGNGMEFVLMSSLGWGGLAVSIFTEHRRSLSMAVVGSGFLTLFATCCSDQIQAVYVAFVWITLCLWWLIQNYWERADLYDAVNVERKTCSRWILVIAGAGVFVASTFIAAQFRHVTQALGIEVMPTSGGSSVNDPAAKNGVGDGNALVAAKQHAVSFGAVESEQFLDSDQPSLFDMYSETFGEPFVKKNFERAIALSSKEEMTQPDKVAEAKSTGASFTLMRNSSSRSQRNSDVASRAILQWIGRSNVRLAVERFDQFDGRDWKRAEANQQRESIVTITTDAGHWFGKANFFPEEQSIFVGTKTESLKFTGFRSPVIPTSSDLRYWSVSLVDNPEFFAFSRDACLSMPDREHVPDYTIVHLANREIDRGRLEDAIRTTYEDKLVVKHSVSEKVESDESELSRLARQWTDGIPIGWSQIECVIQTLRSNYRVDKTVSFVDEAQTPIEKFLAEKRGSDTLFATTAALMLRELGYETRFVTGFFVHPDASSFASQTLPIHSEDLHAWLEVRAANDMWVPLEPCPDFPLPVYHVSWWYLVRSHATSVLLAIVSMVAVGFGVWMIRRWLFEMVCRLAIAPIAWQGDTSCVQWLMWILDMRCRMAGLTRPHQVAPRQWLLRHLTRTHEELLPAVTRFFDEADRLWFGGGASLTSEGRLAWRTLYRQLDSTLLRRLAQSQSIAP